VTVPVTPAAALIAERLADRRADLADESQQAIEVAAVILERLHDRLYGSAAAVSGDRTPRYRRAQLAGEKSLPIEDLVYLATVAPEAVASVVDVLAMICDHDQANPRSVCETNGGVLRIFGDFEATLSEALEDGTLTAAEKWDLLDRHKVLMKRVKDLNPAILEAK